MAFIIALALLITTVTMVIEFWAQFFEDEKTARKRRQHQAVLDLHYKYIKEQHLFLSESELNTLKRHLNRESEGN